jgi:hypothetical protein
VREGRERIVSGGTENSQALPVHPHGNEANAVPGVESAVEQLQFGRARLEPEEAEGGCQIRAATVGHVLRAQGNDV